MSASVYKEGPMGDVIVLAVLGLAILLAVSRLRKEKKSGCCGNCGSCSGCCSRQEK